MSSMATVLQNFTEGMDKIKVNADVMDKIYMEDSAVSSDDIQ